MPVAKMRTKRVRVDVRDVIRWIDMEREHWQRSGRDILQTCKERGLEIIREEVPKGKTLELHNSCWSEVSGHTVKIGTAVPYDKYVDGEGSTASSPGRYVPAIDKRLVRPSFRNPDIGVHPGSRRTPYGRRTAERVRLLASMELSRAIGGAQP